MKWKIAIASSGLGHVRRGIESWANDLGTALHRIGANVTLFQGAPGGAEPWRRVMACCRRFEPPVRRIRAVTKRLSGWRYGCGSEYDVEQSTFSFSLWRAIHRDFDLLHVQDYRVARIFDVLHRRGLSRPRVIFCNGTEESNTDLQKFRYLQHLAPYHEQCYEPHKLPRQLSFAIPCFVDTELYRPGNRIQARAAWNLPQDALIVLSVAALRKTHKRCDYLIREFAAFRESAGVPTYLVMVGARETETEEIAALGKSLLGDSLLMLESVDRSKLPSLYHAADIFAIASLFEMLGIVILEASASGIPISCNNAPILEWVVGAGGAPEDISVPGGLVRQWQRLADPQVRSTMAAAAREHVEKTFSEHVVVRQVSDMYEAVMANASGRKG